MPKLEVVNANNVIEFNPQKANFKLKNTGGPKGETGAQGPKGDTGPQGLQGPAGASASVTVGSTTTLSPGAAATVTNSGDTRNAILNFGIPTGARGPKGDTGSKGDTGPMGPKGAKGDTGAAATVQVGNTNTGAPGTNAQVTNAGNEHFAVFNFTIPRGDKGEKGDTGAQGAKGDKGDKGDAGTVATITVGSTTTTNPGTNATVTNSGTTSAAVLNFGIPRGATGSVKSDVVAELPETGEEDTFYLVNREATEQTATGKTISFENSDNAGDITDFKLKGETSQQTYTGKNLVYTSGKTDGGITATYNAATGETTISGKAQRSYAVFGAVEDIFPAGTYTFSIQSAAPCAVGVATRASGGTRQGHAISAGATKTTFTISEDSEQYDIYLTGLTANTTYSFTFKAMLESGSSATSFEPYTNGPAPNPDYPQAVQTVTGENVVKISDGQGNEQSYEVNLGKNLFDKDNASTIGAYITFGTSTIVTDGANTSIYIPCQPNTTYTISKTADNVFRAGTTSVVPANGAAVKNMTDNASGTKITLTSASDAKYLVVFIRNNSSSHTAAELMASLQIELGSQATSYAAYFTPIELCKIGDYQDSIYKSGGKWYVHKETGKYTFDGTENWIKVAMQYSDGYFTTISDIEETGSSIYVAYPIYSAHFSAVAPTASWATPVGGSSICRNQGGKVVRFSKGETKNTGEVTTWKAWVASVGLTVYYPLATPTDTEITNEALVAQLDNVASAPLYTGVNNITTITPNEQGTLEIKYVTYDKYNQNKVYIWNDTLQQWQIIVP